jgi:hypothetical protein
MYLLLDIWEPQISRTLLACKRPVQGFLYLLTLHPYIDTKLLLIILIFIFVLLLFVIGNIAGMEMGV